MAGKDERGSAEFWREFEETRGEKTLAFAMGRLFRWPADEGAPPRGTAWSGPGGPLWGLLIAVESGFVFHHFPRAGWLRALGIASGGEEAPAAKTLFIPKDRFMAVSFTRGKSLLRGLIIMSEPVMRLRYRTETGAEAVLAAETFAEGEEVARRLTALLPASARRPEWAAVSAR